MFDHIAGGRTDLLQHGERLTALGDNLDLNGAVVDARDANGDIPLSWASWHLRPRRSYDC